MSPPFFSIVICCYNSSNKIAETLDAIFIAIEALKNEEKCEVIVIDNNSNDSTSTIVKEYSLSYKRGISVFHEPKAGLSNARIAGLNRAIGNYILYVDDDNSIDSNYLIEAKSILSKFSISQLGGESRLPEYLDAPPWFCSVAEAYAVGKQHSTDGFVPRTKVLWGAGMIIKRKDFINLLNGSWTFSLTGRSGTLVLSGEDAELSLALALSGFPRFYSSKLKLIHRIDKSRINVRTYISLMKSFGVASNVTFKYLSAISGSPKYRLCFYIALLQILIFYPISMSNSPLSIKFRGKLHFSIGVVLGKYQIGEKIKVVDHYIRGLLACKPQRLQ